MDRQIVYPGSIPLDTDLLNTQRFVLETFGGVLGAVIGTATALDGLACFPTIPASFTLEVGPGIISQQSVVDATPFGSLPAATEALAKIGINIDSTPFTFQPPGTPGVSQCFLIQAQLSEVDANPVALPYYNAANPTQAFSGPGNSGTPQDTQRLERVALQVKPGSPAPSGSEVAPGADAGWVPAWIITVNNGDPAITQASVTMHPAAPFLQRKLGLLRATGLRAVYTQAGAATWTCPPFLNEAFVAVTGVGGAGSNGTITSPGHGGGGGGYAAGLVPVVPGTTYTINVGLFAGVGVPGQVTTAFGLTANAGGNASGSGPGAGGTASGGAKNLQGGGGGYGSVAGGTAYGGSGGASAMLYGPNPSVNSPGPATPGQNGSTGQGGTGAPNGNGGNGGGAMVEIYY